jgi:hypothetical protein
MPEAWCLLVVSRRGRVFHIIGSRLCRHLFSGLFRLAEQCRHTSIRRRLKAPIQRVVFRRTHWAHLDNPLSQTPALLNRFTGRSIIGCVHVYLLMLGEFVMVVTNPCPVTENKPLHLLSQSVTV